MTNQGAESRAVLQQSWRGPRGGLAEPRSVCPASGVYGQRVRRVPDRVLPTKGVLQVGHLAGTGQATARPACLWATEPSCSTRAQVWVVHRLALLKTLGQEAPRLATRKTRLLEGVPRQEPNNKPPATLRCADVDQSAAALMWIRAPALRRMVLHVDAITEVSSHSLAFSGDARQ